MPERILVVDDEAIIALDIETLLADAGHTVIGIERDVAAAVERLKRGDVTLAILDAELNGESAEPVALALRALSVPFCVVSGYDASQLTWLGGDAHLQKPFEESVLLDMVRSLRPPHSHD
ncbi:MAG: response regulator [Beijerinckiaceae bacterium]